MSGIPGEAEDPGVCSAAFNPNAARQLYDRVVGRTGNDGCTLEDVKTDRTRMEVVWKKASGEVSVTILVEPRGCSASTPRGDDPFVMTAPPEAVLACPDAVATVASALHASTSPTVRIEETFPLRTAVVAWAVLLVLLLGAGAVAARGLRRGAG
jgi:hypothetical protein